MAIKGFGARFRAWMIEYAYLVTLGAIAAIVASSALYTYQLRAGEGIQAAAPAPETAETATPEALPRITPLPSIAPLVPRTEIFRMAGATVWPVSGKILRGHDVQEMVYWEALGCYKPHAGLDIAAQAGEEVKCIADGVIEAVWRDELWGWQISVAQTDGREIRYAGLLAADVNKGQAVTRGQTLGILMDKISVEGEMPAHVHVEMRMDGTVQDPEAILPEGR